jgi:RNase P protein component
MFCAGGGCAAASASPWSRASGPRPGMRRAHRLRARADFERVRGLRRSWAHPLFMLYTAPNELGHPRLGVSVSRRIGTAVVRNRVRRRISEAARLSMNDPEWPAAHRTRSNLEGEGGSRRSSPPSAPRPRQQGHDLLFIARPPAAAADWESMRAAVDELLRRASPTLNRAMQGEGV